MSLFLRSATDYEAERESVGVEAFAGELAVGVHTDVMEKFTADFRHECRGSRLHGVSPGADYIVQRHADTHLCKRIHLLPLPEIPCSGHAYAKSAVVLIAGKSALRKAPLSAVQPHEHSGIKGR